MNRRSVNPWHLVEMLGDWSTGRGPLYRQLADAIARSVDQGDLRPGARLPAERTMASLLTVSRTTVVAAMDLLKTRGYLDSSPGSGTWVRAVRGFNPRSEERRVGKSVDRGGRRSSRKREERRGGQ